MTTQTVMTIDNTPGARLEILPTMGSVIWQYLNAGLSIIPIDDTSKRPLARLLPVGDDGKPSWKPYQQRLPLSTEIDHWLDAGVQSIAVVFGPVSGNAEVLDFDDNADATPRPFTADEFWGAWWAECGAEVEQYGLPHWRTGGGGYQAAYRCETIQGNQQLAWVPDERKETGRAIAIETRGEGGYALVPPSLHPTGNRYTMLGGDLAHIPTIPTEVRAKFLTVARKLCLAPYAKKDLAKAARTHTQKQKASGNATVIERFNAKKQNRSYTGKVRLHP